MFPDCYFLVLIIVRNFNKVIANLCAGSRIGVERLIFDLFVDKLAIAEMLEARMESRRKY